MPPVDEPDLLPLAFAGLLVGTVLLHRESDRDLGGSGLVAFGLAVAALWSVGSGGEVGSGFATGNAALLQLGVLTALLAAGRGAAGHPRGWWRVGPSLLLMAALGGLLAAAPVLRAGGLRAVGVAVATALLVTAFRALFRVVAARARGSCTRSADALLQRPHPVGLLSRRVPLSVGAAGVLAVAVGQHVAVIFLGVLATALVASMMARGSTGPVARSMLPALMLVLLLPAYWLLATIAGPIGLDVASLDQVPLSPAAERLVAPALMLAAWTCAGLWPLHSRVPGGLLAPVGALLLVRVAVPTVPAGMEHWRALAYPWTVIGIWHAMATRRGPLLASGGALLALFSLAPEATRSAALLLAGGVGLELLGRVAGPTGPAGIVGEQFIRRLCWLSMGWGGLLASSAGLRAEVGYTVVAAAAIAIGLQPVPVQPMIASAPRNGAASV